MGQLGDLSPEASVAVGILVGLISTSIQSLGLTLQRQSHLLEEDKDPYEVRRPPYKRTRWQLGMGMFVISNLVGSTVQITTLPLPVLSTLQASGLVFNTAFATILLHERFTRYSLVGTILTCAGAALIAIFGAIGEPAHSLPQLLALLARRQFVLWMVGTFLVVIATIAFSHFLKVIDTRNHSYKYERSASTTAARLSTANLKRRLTINLPPAMQVRTYRLRFFRGLCYALISGILSAHSLLVAKSAVELLVRTVIDRNNQFRSYQSWLILLSLIALALGQLYYLHLGLRLCSTSVLYPFVFCIYNIIAILDGLIYFRQTSRISGLHAGLIALGTAILLAGVLALSWRLDDTTPSDPGSATQPTVPTLTPLTPGLGMVSAVDENASPSPQPPTARPRTSASLSSLHSANETAPLLYRRSPRVPSLSIYPPPPETGDAKGILAELEDSGEESDKGDVLSALPRTRSPYLSHTPIKPRRRSRVGSVSTLPGPDGSILSHSRVRGTSFGSEGDTHKQGVAPPRRTQTVQAKPYEERRRKTVSWSEEAVLPTSLLGKSTESLPSERGLSPRTTSPGPASSGNLTADDSEGHGSDTGLRIRGNQRRSRSATSRQGEGGSMRSRYDQSSGRWTGTKNIFKEEDEEQEEGKRGDKDSGG